MDEVSFGLFGDIGAPLAEVRFVPHSGPFTRRQLTPPSARSQTFIRSLPLYRPSFTPMERRNWLLSASISS